MEKTFNYQNTTISYTIEGKGNALVLLHGFGEDKNIFENQKNFLQQYCQLIIPDLPGSGASSLLEEEEVSMVDYANCVYALLTHEAINKCVVLGHSMGGYVALAFAEKYAAMLTGFGFIHSTASADHEEKKEARLKGIEMIKEYGAYSFLKNTSPNLFSEKFKQSQPNIISAFIENGKKFSIEALSQYYKAMMNRPDRTNVLKAVNVPVLFIIGTEDVAAPLKDLLQQVYLPKIAQINILEGVGHMGMLEVPEKVNESTLHFLTLAYS